MLIIQLVIFSYISFIFLKDKFIVPLFSLIIISIILALSSKALGTGIIFLKKYNY